MLLLALDTATPVFSGCLLDEGRVRSEWTVRARLPGDLPRIGILDENLRRAGVDIGDIEALACTAGPGSFTGLRVGLSLAKGLTNFGKVPLFGVSTLHALARTVSPAGQIPVVPCLDARRKQVYAAVYAGEQVLVSEGAYDPADFSAAVTEQTDSDTLWLGDGARAYRSAFERRGRRFSAPEFDFPRGCAVAAIAWEAWLRGERPSSVHLVPRYLRASEAEQKRARSGR